MHLFVDGISNPLPHPDTAVSNILSLCSLIGMTPVEDSRKVYVIPQGWEFGYTITQIIEESHITLHTKENYINMDIFSCKPFNRRKIKHFCKVNFHMTKIKTQAFKRPFGKEIAL